MIYGNKLNSVGQNLDLVCKPIIYYRNSAAAKAPKLSVHSVIPTPLRVDAGGEESLVVTPSDWVVSTKDFVEEASLLAGNTSSYRSHRQLL